MAPLALVVVLVVVGVFVLPLLVVALVLAVAWCVWAAMVWTRSSAAVASRLGGMRVTAGQRPPFVDEAAASRIVDVVEGLCASFGLRHAEVRVIDDPAPNAISVGQRPDEGTIFVTSGLLVMLDRIELEGVVAHELAHLRRGDTFSGDLAARAFGSLGRIGGPLGSTSRGVVGDDREAAADLAAVAVTRYPPGLLAALDKIAAAPRRRPAAVPAKVLDATARLWLAPFEDLPAEPVRPGALDLSERIAWLREL